MTVVFNAHVQQRTWRGYDDPGLPVGMYISQGTVLGDLSGGNQFVNHVFKAGGEPASGRFYSVEQLDVHFSAASTLAMFIVADNFELIGPTGLVNRQWRGLLLDNANGASALSSFNAAPIPLFLGIAAPVDELAAQLQIGVDNVDGVTLFSTVQGYIWEPRSVMSEGGLRRPMDSLYGGGR